VHGKCSCNASDTRVVCLIISPQNKERTDLANFGCVFVVQVSSKNFTLALVKARFGNTHEVAVLLGFADHEFNCVLNVHVMICVCVKTLDHFHFFKTIDLSFLSDHEVLMRVNCVHDAFEAVSELVSLGHKVSLTGKLNH